MIEWVGKSKTQTGLTDYWDEKRRQFVEARAGGAVTAQILRGRILVNAPYSDQFREGANDLGGKFRDRTGRWSFQIKQRRVVAQLIATCYGAEKVPEWMRGEGG